MGIDMPFGEEIATTGGPKLSIEKKEKDGGLELTLRLKSGDPCVLHWGLVPRGGNQWRQPPRHLWPEGSVPAGGEALRSPFGKVDGEGVLTLVMEKSRSFPFLEFALFFPGRAEGNQWDNNHGRNFRIKLEAAEKPAPGPALREWVKDAEVISEKMLGLSGEEGISMALVREGETLGLRLVTDVSGPLFLHWGIAAGPSSGWRFPPVDMRPPGSVEFEGNAIETPFIFSDGLGRLGIDMKAKDAPKGIAFVLRQSDTGRWIQHEGRNFFASLAPGARGEAPSPEEMEEAVREIIRVETGAGSWSLMHRFNLCHDLLDVAGKTAHGLAPLFAWLRFSALRQLPWQRNYNTKPRELSHAQDRLTRRLAGMYTDRGADWASRELIRLMMASLGRGGEGQRVRDEILNIMHRRHIKEVAGHFMEEWHQKLHNNTTPDDVAVCEAYLDFLRKDGDLKAFYQSLQKAGVSRKRLEGFERPIVSAPDFIPHLKDALIEDFEGFLRILKAVHSGTDLETALSAARHLLDPRLSGVLDRIWAERDAPPKSAVELAADITAARGLIKIRLEKEGDSSAARDLIYLDLALEESFRASMEKNVSRKTRRNDLAELAGMALANLRLSYDDAELMACSRWWEKLAGLKRFTHDWSLHAKAADESLKRAVGAYVDRCYGLLQPWAERLGTDFGAERWTITLFTEELVRGRPAFTLSQILRRLEPVLREGAEIGPWQVISPGRATGAVEVVEELRFLQGKRYDRPVVIVAGRVRGDEVPPEGTVAVITPEAADIVSHVAVRARNSRILFAACYDQDCLEKLRSLKGRVISLSVDAAQDVVFEEARDFGGKRPPRAAPPVLAPMPEFASCAIPWGEFREGLLGGKSLNLARLKSRLPDWIGIPRSAAIPFGVFEHVLETPENRETAARCRKLEGLIEADPDNNLAELRSALHELLPPGDFFPSLRRAMEESGIGWPGDEDGIWKAVMRVWASKWNLRAYLSRKALGVPHEALLMAVLVQEVVEADYAFVIHTTNPLTGNKDELFAEVVPGLGETLVGNYPGRAIGFVSPKGKPAPRLLSYPSKSIVLRGGGIIFRSDSNGEDLPGYAGAGLHDSVMLKGPASETMDYTDEPIVWDEALRREIMTNITEIGCVVEKLLGSPQDIEGACSRGRFAVVQSRPQAGV